MSLIQYRTHQSLPSSVRNRFNSKSGYILKDFTHVFIDIFGRNRLVALIVHDEFFLEPFCKPD